MSFINDEYVAELLYWITLLDWIGVPYKVARECTSWDDRDLSMTTGFSIKAATKDYFHYESLDLSICLQVYKMSEKRVKNIQHNFSEHLVTSSNVFLLSDQQSKTQLYYIYNHIKERKTANSHICEAAASRFLVW